MKIYKCTQLNSREATTDKYGNDFVFFPFDAAVKCKNTNFLHRSVTW